MLSEQGCQPSELLLVLAQCPVFALDLIHRCVGAHQEINGKLSQLSCYQDSSTDTSLFTLNGLHRTSPDETNSELLMPSPTGSSSRNSPLLL